MSKDQSYQSLQDAKRALDDMKKKTGIGVEAMQCIKSTYEKAKKLHSEGNYSLSMQQSEDCITLVNHFVDENLSQEREALEEARQINRESQLELRLRGRNK